MNRLLCRSSLLLGGCLAGCFSASPPAPPVRYFDPLPAQAERGEAVGTGSLRVVAAEHLGREFVVRTDARELVFDPLHSWIALPRALVEATLRRAPPVTGDGGAPLEVFVVAFELDLTHEPRAHVGIEVREPGLPMRRLDGWAPALGAEPGQMAAAMAVALSNLAQEWGQLRQVR